MKMPIAIGIDDYKKIVEKPYYYIDKTLLIKELIDKGGEVNLFTRPRRFGKTLALSMIKTFFEDERTVRGEKIENQRCFVGRKILQAGKAYVEKMGKYPVIFLSLKAAKQPDFHMSYEVLKSEIAKEYERHRYVLESENLISSYKEQYRKLMNQRADKAEYSQSLKFLSLCLEKYHGSKAVILIDEYDVPLENAYFRGFYEEMLDFIRPFLEAGLKTNASLEFSVITGCLRISRESIFTGLNNLKIVSILYESYAEYFGFTQKEVEEMLKCYGIADKREEVKTWYDGYRFGNTEVYNPWSVINYVEEMTEGDIEFPKPYWSNTSSNSIIRELVEQADDTVKQEIEILIAGGSLEKPIHEDITYEDIHKTQENLWNFLFFTGYLKAVSKRFEVDTLYMTFTIPNEEVRYIYRNTIREWFAQKIKREDFSDFYKAILAGNCEIVQEVIKKQLRSCISYYDNVESFYHGFLLGLLGGFPEYGIRSNRESGNGRPDLVLLPFDEKNPVVIMELKHARTFRDMEKLCAEALAQIDRQEYEADFLEEGYRSIVKYGICFCKKSCAVKKGK